jgi:hypothetical protein
MTSAALGLLLPPTAWFVPPAMLLPLGAVVYASWVIFTGYGYYKLGLRWHLSIIVGLILAAMITALVFYLALMLPMLLPRS